MSCWDNIQRSIQCVHIADFSGFSDPLSILLPPHKARPQALDMSLRKQIAKYIATVCGVRQTDVLRYVPDALEQWGKVRRANGGDLIHARMVVAKCKDH